MDNSELGNLYYSNATTCTVYYLPSSESPDQVLFVQISAITQISVSTLPFSMQKVRSLTKFASSGTNKATGCKSQAAPPSEPMTIYLQAVMLATQIYTIPAADDRRSRVGDNAIGASLTSLVREKIPFNQNSDCYLKPWLGRTTRMIRQSGSRLFSTFDARVVQARAGSSRQITMYLCFLV